MYYFKIEPREIKILNKIKWFSTSQFSSNQKIDVSSVKNPKFPSIDILYVKTGELK